MEERITRDMILEVQQRVNNLEGYLEIAAKRVSIEKLEAKTNEAGFWEDNQKAQVVLRQIKSDKSMVESWESAHEEAIDLIDYFDLATEEEDEESLSHIDEQFAHLLKKVGNLEFLRKMSGEDDASDAIITIHSGAGGTESCDWADMLYRLYMRYCERNEFSTEILEIQPGDGAGIKSVSIEVKGSYAYGYLNAESGVHRLVRISPFDSNARRHTSFASVHAYPILEDGGEYELDEGDIRVDTYRASGAGGQHVNKTESAVRMTHIPTNIVVQCQNQRSQIKNRETAMKMLKARVRAHFKEEEAKAKQEKMGEKKKIEWGSQIRSYVLHPYNMVKDHRTGFETSNTQAVLDGDITEFIEKYLLEFC